MAENQRIGSSKLVRYLKTFALILLFIFSVAPLVLAAFPNASTNNRFSIYNTGYDGLSYVRNDLESIKIGNSQKYDITTTISNLNVLNRFNGSGALVIVGPSASFEATETFSVLLYLLRGGSLIIADDFGSGNEILEPIFNLFESLDDLCANVAEVGVTIPCVSDILSGDTGGLGNSSNITPDQFGNGDVGSAAGDLSGSFLTTLLKSVKGFGFNTSAVLMDAASNTDNPANPLITDIEQTEIEGMTFTKGVNKVQMEYGSIISIKLKVSEDVYNPDTGTVTKVNKTVWQPLQKLSASLINENIDPNDESFDLGLPFFPLYSSRSSWMETDIPAAKEGTAVPNIGEWGNTKFATALSIPLFPGMGKIVFIADPSIFINRWTSQTDKNDNLLLIRNLMEMATSHQEITAGNPSIPLIFDFGHTYQSLTSPTLYSTALLKLIAEMSMFPLIAPFVPFMAYGYGKKLMPENRRLRPILLTKRRGIRGHSDFDKKLNEIKISGGYGEPISILSTSLVRKVRGDPRFEGTIAKSPKEIAKFFTDFYPSAVPSRRELTNQLKIIFRIAEYPTRRLSLVAAKKHLQILKRLNDLLA